MYMVVLIVYKLMIHIVLTISLLLLHNIGGTCLRINNNTSKYLWLIRPIIGKYKQKLRYQVDTEKILKYTINKLE